MEEVCKDELFVSVGDNFLDKRQPKLTDKMKSFQLDKFSVEFGRTFDKLNKVIKNVQISISTEPSASADQLYSAKASISQIQGELNAIAEKIRELGPSDLSVRIDQPLTDINQSANLLMSQVIKSLPDRPRSVSRSTYSSSRQSHVSQRSSVSSKRLAAEAEAAAIRAKQAVKVLADAKIAEIEATKAKLAVMTREQENLEIQADLDAAMARVQVFKEEERLEQNCFPAPNVVIDRSHSMDRGQLHFENPMSRGASQFESVGSVDFLHPSKSNLNPLARPYNASQYESVRERKGPQSSVISSESSLADALAQAFTLSRLPVAEPPVFTGNPLHYPDWKASFSVLIEGKGLSTSDKLHFLKKYVGGPAREAISGFFLLSSDEAYEKARLVLESRFGNEFVLSDGFKKKLDAWPKIGKNDPTSLQRFSDFLVQCQAATAEITTLKSLNDIREIQRIASKLPDGMSNSWNRLVAKKRREESRYPDFSDFVQFVSVESDTANDPALISSWSTNVQGPSQTQFVHRPAPVQNKRTLLTTGDAQTVPTCEFCQKKGHGLSDCRNFTKKTNVEKKDFIQKSNLCFACLGSGHFSKHCRNRLQCKVCRKGHPTCLHDDNFKRSESENKKEQSQKENKLVQNQYTERKMPAEHVVYGSNTQSGRTLTSMVLPVFLSAKNNPTKEVLVYALIDTMSDATFVTSAAVSELQTVSEPVKLRLTTLNSNSIIESKKHSQLQVRAFRSDKYVDLPPAYQREHIPVADKHIPTPDTAVNWPHLQGIRNQLVHKQDCPVGLLIGYDCPQAMMPLQSITGGPQEPFALETPLGWSIIGGTHSSPDVEPFDDLGHSHTFKTQIKEISAAEILNVMERDFSDNSHDSLSQQDMQFLKILNEGIKQREDGFYELPLPFKNGEPNLPNNKQAAWQRAMGLKSQLQKKPELKEQYTSFMQGVIDRGEAEKVPLDQLSSQPSWYIPHHGVYHPHKPDKLRVVFDCSARYKDACLNDELLQGPDLTNPLIGVLTRFRKGAVAFALDIEKMFHQFRVASNHSDYLRFLWWEDGDLSRSPAEYRMKVHLFGAVSSPGCANFGLKQIAKDYSHISSEASQFLIRHFYVDDGLKSEETVEEAKKVIFNAQKICSKANLKLHKITSNSSEVLQALGTNAEERELEIDTKSSEKTLGLSWCTSKDTFQYKHRLTDKPNTHRGVLSTVASVFDPLGLIAPIIVVGRMILQKVCRESVGWDQNIAEHLKLEWEKWRNELSKLGELSIPRCVHPPDFGKPLVVQVHHFSDASLNAFGQCSYLRLQNAEGTIHCSLIMAKARVAPIKNTMTIPRLELQAATLSAKVAKTLDVELDYPDMTHFFWSDSKVVLGYIKNASKRYHMFVANRVQTILQVSKPEQWNYVTTKDNPADHVSRGLSVKEIQSSNWFSGPKFLWQPELSLKEVDFEVSPDDVEVKSVTSHLVQTPQHASFEQRVSKFSSFTRLVKAYSVILSCILQKKGMVVSAKEIKSRVERTLIHGIQAEAFSHFPNARELRSLCPFRDDQNLLRVGGRLDKADESYDVKHPIILPKRSHLSKLIAKDAHEKCAHQGRNMTINKIRSTGFWILGCRGLVSSIINKCTKCIRMRKNPEGQKMSSLPLERVTPSPPFTHCGMDVFGPLLVKEGRREVKRYGLLFTCLALRAVHIEVLDDLSTDAFMNGLRSFMAIRGEVQTLFCDQGTNFVGAKNELADGLDRLDKKLLQSRLVDCGCEFRFNTPASSHMGGVWERQIRTVKSVLTGLMDSSQGRLDTASLRTLMYEAAAVVNSRPLTVENLERPDGPTPLSPNHLLTMKKGVVTKAPPGQFLREDLYLRKRWRRVQYLVELFWNRWKKEYLLSLQCRNVWQNQKPETRVGDVVILQDESVERSNWRLARVVEVWSSKDGLVRKARLLMPTSSLDRDGKAMGQRSYLNRPVHKLITLVREEA